MNNLTFHLEGIVRERDDMRDFEGPLTLILMLLSKNKIEIRDIRVSEILDQYLAHLAKMQEMDLDVASEFVQMASHLLYIKTRTLLAGDEEEVSELQQLIDSLEQLKNRDIYNAVKAVSGPFSRMADTGAALHVRPRESLPLSRDYGYSHTEAELLEALSSVFLRHGKVFEPPDIRKIAPARIPYGIREKSRQLIGLLRGAGAVSLSSLYELCASRSELVATFISVLELCSAGSLQIGFDTDGYSVTFCGGDTEALLDAISE